ncbi:uncharacterized protein LOC121412959 [Lytechinus variegatus]|uniref:uncharacterized protein LOC121412959 n=1 Tax=Lytechinus variegatus TaxID=7654 RepID=UPI001BB17D7B|nr:uncharacterized protein LOC121412959 [Lytechinus variegatus]
MNPLLIPSPSTGKAHGLRPRIEFLPLKRRNKEIGNLTKKRQRSNRFRRRTNNNDASPHLVVNLSSSPLSQAETSLLSKGLKFCPTPPEVEQIALSQDLSTFYRGIRLKEFFLDEPPSDPEPFYRKSTWTPAKNRVPSLETQEQGNRSDIIIKPANKGSAVVVMDRQQYIDKAMKHLNNRSHYALLDSDPTCNFSLQIQSTLNDMKEHKHLSEKAHKFLSPTNAKPARFYLLPKIHKPGNPGRPILSGNGSPTENISLFVDYHIKPLVSRAPSYIHDTPDFLRKLNDIKDQIPETALIGTLDVSSLYANIPHDEGIQASREALTASVHSSPPISDIKSLMSHVLTKKQLHFHGSALPTDIRHSNGHPDGSFIRLSLHDQAGTADETHFLDVTVQKKPNGITTTLYTKPTDTHQYLHSSSCHPRHCKTGIAYSQALRLRRICSEDPDFSFHTRNLQKHLCARGHGARAVQLAINKVRSLPRSEVLKPKSNKKTTDRIPLVTTFHPNLPPLRKILCDNHHILHTSDRLQQAVPDTPF